MIVVNVHEAKSTLSKLLARVEQGEQVVIARAGEPVAELIPHRRAGLVLGTAAGLIQMADDAFTWPDHDLAAAFYGAD